MTKEEQLKALKELIGMLKEVASEMPEAKAIKLNLNNIEFDEEGRVIIKDPEIAKLLKKLLEEGKDVSIGEVVNGGCINIGFCS